MAPPEGLAGRGPGHPPGHAVVWRQRRHEWDEARREPPTSTGAAARCRHQSHTRGRSVDVHRRRRVPRSLPTGRGNGPTSRPVEPGPSPLLVGTDLEMLLVALVTGGIAFQQRSTAEDNGRRHEQEHEDADFERLTSQAVDLLDSDRSLAFLLALEAPSLRDDPEPVGPVHHRAAQRRLPRVQRHRGASRPGSPWWTTTRLPMPPTTAARDASIWPPGQPVARPVRVLGRATTLSDQSVRPRDHQRDEGEPVVVAPRRDAVRSGASTPARG